MSWMTSIVSWLKSIEEYFYDAYLEVYGWVYPFWLLSYPLLYISRGFGWLAYYFSLFNNWLVWASDELGDILSWSTIWSYILSYVPNLVSIRDWFYSWYTNVTGAVSSWWSSMQWTVRGWIDAAVQGLGSIVSAWDGFWNNLWPQLVTDYNGLKVAWDNFWTVTFPSLVSFDWLGIWWNNQLKEIAALMRSELKSWFPFYDDLAKLWSSIAEFFTDPVEYIWGRFTEWFLGPGG